jgi:hypothetical protein
VGIGEQDEVMLENPSACGTPDVDGLALPRLRAPR